MRSNNNTIDCCLQGHKGLPGEPGKDGEPGEKVGVLRFSNRSYAWKEIDTKNNLHVHDLIGAY